jgi:hypothetical protein
MTTTDLHLQFKMDGGNWSPVYNPHYTDEARGSYSRWLEEKYLKLLKEIEEKSENPWASVDRYDVDLED